MKIIYPYLMNDEFEKVAVIDDYKSLIWTTRYWACGDFELLLPVKYKTLIEYGFYIWRDDDPRTGVIEYIEMNHDSDKGEVLLIKGRFLESILARRVIPDITNLSGTPGAVIKDLVNLNLTVSGSGDVNRGIQNFSISPGDTGGDTIDVQAEMGAGLLDTVSGIAELYEIGFKVELIDYSGFRFSVFKGADRSYNSGEEVIVYSDEFDNLFSSTYIENYQEFSNAVLVGGEGEGTSRVRVWSDINPNLNPLYRYESFKDAESSSSELVEYAVYLQQLKTEANQALTKTSQTFGASVDFKSYRWNEEVFIGDIVEVVNQSWGISYQARIIEVIESIDESGEYSLIPTFTI